MGAESIDESITAGWPGVGCLSEASVAERLADAPPPGHQPRFEAGAGVPDRGAGL
jgi:hypothetical protein